MKSLDNHHNQLPEYTITSHKLFTILKIIFLVGVFVVIAFNVLSAPTAAAFLEGTNATDIDGGLEFMDNNDNETDQKLEEEDERQHLEESKEYYDDD